MKLDLSKINNEELLENLEFLISEYALDFQNISLSVFGIEEKEKISNKEFYKNLFQTLESLNETNKNYKYFLKEAKKRNLVKNNYYKKNLNYIVERN